MIDPRDMELERLRRRLATVEKLVGKLPGRTSHHQTVKAVVDMAAEMWGVASRDITGPLRHQALVEPRFAVYWVARQALPMSLPQIGRAVGSRDHTTVMHGIRQADRMRARSWEFRRLTDAMVKAMEEEAEADRRALVAMASASPQLQLEAAE